MLATAALEVLFGAAVTDADDGSSSRVSSSASGPVMSPVGLSVSLRGAGSIAVEGPELIGCPPRLRLITSA